MSIVTVYIVITDTQKVQKRSDQLVESRENLLNKRSNMDTPCQSALLLKLEQATEMR